MPTSRTLLVLGSGPGIGVAVASRFAQEHFDCVAIFARTGSQLQLDQDAIHTAVQKVRREVVVKAWQVDITRVGGSNFFDFPTEEMKSDFQWAVPLLLKNKEKNPGLDYKPSILVTSSLLPVDPIPELFSLSLVKAAQANMVKSLEKMFRARGMSQFTDINHLLNAEVLFEELDHLNEVPNPLGQNYAEHHFEEPDFSCFGHQLWL
ncbi:predicted protein [Aspergillus nidulans FGSC A4]|uniref:Short-chain alcohol dehydrogenase, putative (AFU_orthologue AFUA_3G03445) n=1 Tax=Emericella nidulans (strain FGSC A4 / ATCC 38163 / CBS 112.46 / NRRL 194 / M139) TaxID=227321 RepID=Q5ATT1_EMENI|nr:hypothetical protein [Aspergillus nidulans FGSC A4]EAA66864.1 predicted protein [Aspergillus nidulans FGSC A4]CBF80261.1 TPA: short-chain alcohol dehydrogenase, putative (AFU_orthologue; AFUA_3G03445) [Aspergillus nidulans FGSC A4]|eukprot:XP_681568.1 predicted protein [Aspergillus nidulans FGSC A4]